MSDPSPDPTGQGRFLSRKEAAAYVGIGIRKFDELRAAQNSSIRFPEYWIGGRGVFLESELRDAVLNENGRRGPKGRHPQRRQFT